MTTTKKPAKNAPAAPSQPWASPAAATATPAPATETSPETDNAPQENEVAETAEDVSRREMNADLDALTDDERAAFEAFMLEQARAKLKQLRLGRQARAMEVNIIDGNGHYGTRATAARNKSVEA